MGRKGKRRRNKKYPGVLLEYEFMLETLRNMREERRLSQKIIERKHPKDYVV